MMVDKGDGIRGIDANLWKKNFKVEEGVRTCIIYLLVATIVRWSLLVYGQSTSLHPAQWRTRRTRSSQHPRSLETTDVDDVYLFVWFSSTNKSTILIPRIIIHKDSAAAVPEFIRNDCPLAISIWDPFPSLPFLCHFSSSKVS